MCDNKVWWKKDAKEFERFKRELEEFENLAFSIQGNKVIINGSWPVFGKETLIRRYDIRIEIPDDFPDCPPKVFETGGSIPLERDYHINTVGNGGDNSACLFVQPERFEKWPVGAGIRDFLKGPVKEFFFSQAYKKCTGKWPFGQWSHGVVGIIEFYANRLNIDRLDAIIEMLDYCTLPKLYRQWKCPCGSGKRVTACHAEKIRTIAKVIPLLEIKKGIVLAREEHFKGLKRILLRSSEGNS